MEKNSLDMLERQTSINQAFGEMYFAIYSIDMVSGRYLEVSTLDIFREHIPPTEKNQLLFDMVVQYYVSEGYKEKMSEFLSMETLQKRFSQQNAVSCEFFGTTQGWCRASFVVEKRDDSGKVLRFVYVTQEINEEVKSEQARIAELKRAYEAADTANRAKSEFLLQMSHDIRTPMNAIIGFTDLAITHAEERERLLDYLRKIQTSSSHLLSLINDILDMSRIESGKVKLEESEVSLPAVLRDIQSIVQADAQAKGLRMLGDLVDVTDETVWCDKLRLNQILLNCMSNAVKFTPAGGTIGLKIAEEPCGRAGFASYRFQVRDTGIGMSEEFLSHIFEPFERERTAAVSEIQGTGLGMAITKNIVDLMGGTISVVSRQGEGSEFTVSLTFRLADAGKASPRRGVRLPAGDGGTGPSAGRAQPPDSSREKPPGLDGVKILLVEDNDMNREIAQELLSGLGARIDCAVNGLEAVQKVSGSAPDRYDLILMDVQMPVMDGYTATERIRALDGERAALPVIAMTANAFEEDQRAALACGMDGYAAKPIDIRSLAQTVRQALKGRAAGAGQEKD